MKSFERWSTVPSIGAIPSARELHAVAERDIVGEAERAPERGHRGLVVWSLRAGEVDRDREPALEVLEVLDGLNRYIGSPSLIASYSASQSSWPRAPLCTKRTAEPLPSRGSTA